MATTLTNLTLKIAAEKSILEARKLITPVAQFATEFVAAKANVGDTVRVPVYAQATAAAFNAASNHYRSATTEGVDGVDISLTSHPISGYCLKPADVDETAIGKEWFQKAAMTTTVAVARSLASGVCGLINTTNCTATAKVLALADVTLANLAQLRATCNTNGVAPERTVVLLSPEYYAAVLGILPWTVLGGQQAILEGRLEKLFGFKSICQVNEFTAAANGATTVGALVPEDSIAIATRFPTVLNGATYEGVGIMTDDDTGFGVQYRIAPNLDTDTRYLSTELIYGAKVVQGGKIALITNA